MFANIAQWAPSIPLLIGLIRIRSLSTNQKWLLLLLAMMLLIQWIGDLVAITYKNNNPVFHAYCWLEFALIAMVYRKELGRMFPALKTGIIALVGAFTLLSLADLLFLNGPLQAPTYARTTEIILVLLLGFTYFGLVYREMKIVFMERHFLFWFTTGNLLFFSFNLLTYFLTNMLVINYPEIAFFFYPFHSTTVILLNLFYAIALTRLDPVEENLEDASKAKAPIRLHLLNS